MGLASAPPPGATSPRSFTDTAPAWVASGSFVPGSAGALIRGVGRQGRSLPGSETRERAVGSAPASRVGEGQRRLTGDRQRGVGVPVTSLGLGWTAPVAC